MRFCVCVKRFTIKTCESIESNESNELVIIFEEFRSILWVLMEASLASTGHVMERSVFKDCKTHCKCQGLGLVVLRKKANVLRKKQKTYYSVMREVYG